MSTKPIQFSYTPQPDLATTMKQRSEYFRRLKYYILPVIQDYAECHPGIAGTIVAELGAEAMERAKNWSVATVRDRSSILSEAINHGASNRQERSQMSRCCQIALSVAE